jgi:hypothetical protein
MRLPEHAQVASILVTSPDFATTLEDGRRVVGLYHAGDWTVHVYSAHDQPRLLGYRRAATRLATLEAAALTAEDPGEVLARIGI